MKRKRYRGPQIVFALQQAFVRQASALGSCLDLPTQELVAVG
jgi:hypothetical protein